MLATWIPDDEVGGVPVQGPFILAMLFVINLVTSPGHWWVQWAALGIASPGSSRCSECCAP